MLKTNVLISANDYPGTFKILFHEKHRGASKGQRDSVLFTLSHIWAWCTKKMGYLRGRTGRNPALKRKGKENKKREELTEEWCDASSAGCALFWFYPSSWYLSTTEALHPLPLLVTKRATDPYSLSASLLILTLWTSLCSKIMMLNSCKGCLTPIEAQRNL